MLNSDSKVLSKNYLKLSLGALGVVYGDIGTSPLYTLKECFSPAHGLPLTNGNILGILSLVFWSLMLVVILKYILFILRADNQGEGGIMSLLSLIIPETKSARILAPTIILGLLGTSLLLADGIITPAITVLGAVEGLEIASPEIKNFIIPVSVAILLGLFYFQKKGTEKIGNVFGSLMIIWFVVIGILGVINILKAPQVAAAVNPYYAVNFFIQNKFAGFLVLGSVILAITGTEALYADIGHFGKSPIKFSFFTLVMPSLILNYFGQGAAVMTDGAKAIINPFYYICPSWFIYPLIIIATIAAIIASQALISGAFSLVQQASQLGYLPKLHIIHTSEDVKGQIYIPVVNHLLMIACIALVISFKTSGNLASAYGMSVMGTMLCTTILFYILTHNVWKWSIYKSLPLSLLFIIIDLSFFSANFSKLLTGGWFPLLVAIVLYFVMKSWNDGSNKIKRFMSGSYLPLEFLIKDIANGKHKIARVDGTAVFMVGNLENLGVLLHHIKHNKVLHNNVVLLTISPENVPYTKISGSVNMKKLEEGFYTIEAKCGYMETPDIKKILATCSTPEFNLNINQVSFYLGRVNIDLKKSGRFVMWQKKIFSLMHKNATPAMDYFHLPAGRVIELGAKVLI